MATVAPTRRRRPSDSFRIHEDVPSTADTEMSEHAGHDEDEDGGEEVDDQYDSYSESSEEETLDANIQYDMDKLSSTYPGFRQKYRLIKRIGEGPLSPTRLAVPPPTDL